MKTDYIKTLHDNYQNVINSFIRDFPDKVLISVVNIDEYVRSCAIVIWSKGNADAEDCRSVLNRHFCDTFSCGTFLSHEGFWCPNAAGT